MIDLEEHGNLEYVPWTATSQNNHLDMGSDRIRSESTHRMLPKLHITEKQNLNV
jgi:hypothetical protein